ncbi:endonuclease/exonuclease/phosphatase family protein [Dactylosporangium matsuzakiense]|uniref:Endonuclease n=2 Tax=Dactylosporangium matsuzakiense TaxID=53360 RepID=A0A9W6KQF6_9ACTN|nr:endonuclease [Dactylosporangium matsuzakiense]
MTKAPGVAGVPYPGGMAVTEDTLRLPPEKPLRRGRRRWWGALVWLLVLPFAAWAAVRVFGLESGFPAVQLMAFTPYVAGASLVPLLVALVTRRVWPAVVTAVATVALAACVLPRWISDSAPEPGGPGLRVLSVNMLFGGADPGTIVGLVRQLNVDLVALQEYTPEAQSALRAAGLEAVLPNAVSYPKPGVTGSAVYSRFPVTDLGYRQFPSTFGQARASVAVPGAKDVRVESVHPCAPASSRLSHCWEKDIALEPAATPDGAVSLLLGDFNATLDHAKFRELLDTGYRDAADVAGAGFDASWPYDERWFIPGVVLDHVVADRRVGVGKVSVHQMPQSDHKAVFAELVLPKA